MTAAGSSITYDLAHDYLEVARAAASVLGPPSGFSAGRHHHSGVHNAVYAVLSVSTIFSHMAVEAFVAQEEAKAGTAAPLRGLDDRIEALCRWKGLPELAQADPGLLKGLRALAADFADLMASDGQARSRPQDHAASLMARSEPLAYPAVAEAILRHLHGGEDGTMPPWLATNVLLNFRAFLVD